LANVGESGESEQTWLANVDKLSESDPFSKRVILASTVKPVYNGHPWDLKNVAVKQRVMLKRSVVSRLQAGR
jgi:hypothetical protein